MQRSIVVLGLGLLVAACGKDDTEPVSDGSGDAGMTTPGTSNADGATMQTSAPDTNADATMGQDGQNTTAADDDGPVTGATDATAGTSTGVATEAGSGSGSDSGSSGDSGTAGLCDGRPEFSYIWIANSLQGTVSKIDTETLVEEGRYLTRPDGVGDPSRTSVSLSGNVAVANRSGGLTKIFARLDECPDPVNTATDENYLAWQDGCIAWHTPMVYASQRPVAWAPGDFDPNTCTWSNEKVWTSGANATIDVLLLDGDTGAIEQTIPLPGVEANFYGIYGAASDGEGNFWGTQLGGGQLVRIDRVTFAVETWNQPAGGYGMAVDENGRAWTCAFAAARFDYPTQSWMTNNVAQGSGGCMPDGNGLIWLSGSNNNLVALDVNTLAVAATLPLPSYAHGVSIDYAGYVWGVSLQQPWAWRVDPATGATDTFTGLTGPYTYSDMTGHGLSVAVGPS